MRTTWRESKDAGNLAFNDGKYPEALTFYLTALEQLSDDEHENYYDAGARRDDHSKDRQILLSNVIACRLKVGGEDMATKAVEEAKECIRLNNSWPKAHVRLASAYIALGGHSNDACLSLQRALSLDRTNKVAREMLVNELRRRDQRPVTTDVSNNTTGENSGDTVENESTEGNLSTQPIGSLYHPTEETPREYSATPSAPPYPSPENHNTQSNIGNDHGDIDIDDVDDPPADRINFSSISERIQFYYLKAFDWYQTQSDDIKMLLKVTTFFLILYVALGGRFGLDYALGNNNATNYRGNYGEGNAYDRYRHRQTSSNFGHTSGHHSAHRHGGHHQSGPSFRDTATSGSGYNDRTNPQNNRYYSRYEDESYYAPPRNHNHSPSFQLPNLFDGSMISLALLLIIGSVCRYFGVNPFQVFWLLNLMQRRHGGHHHGGFRMGGFGGYGGYGGGFGRHRYGFGRGRGGYY
mmetsp:Transcript_28088/g.57537  ORF Transcript_28088/g.57537 Transcript_28088/m.57537 type:complete len:466 (+) Transcript_28088:150-1547(+)